MLLLCFPLFFFGQKKGAQVQKKTVAKTQKTIQKPDLTKINDSVAALIPYKKEMLFGFQNQKGKVIIPPQYSNVGFFTEDCQLLNSPNAKVKKFGASQYASVRKDTADYRIDTAGKRVYRYKKSDLGKCASTFKQQLFHAYILNNNYGIIEDSKFENPADYRQYKIYPQFEYLHIMEGDDLKNPMIVAAHDNLFGVIDINGKVVIPFEYADIKRNYSWKLARLFEVTKDGKNYFYVDAKNHAY